MWVWLWVLLLVVVFGCVLLCVGGGEVCVGGGRGKREGRGKRREEEEEEGNRWGGAGLGANGWMPGPATLCAAMGGGGLRVKGGLFGRGQCRAWGSRGCVRSC